MSGERIAKNRGGRPPERDEAKRAAISMRITPGTRAALDAAAAREGRSLAQEVEQRLERSIEMESLQGGPQSSALLLRIAAELKAVEAFSGKSWDQDLATWYTAKRIISDVMNQYRPATEGKETFMAAQAARDRSLKVLGIVLASKRKVEEANLAIPIDLINKLDLVLKEVATMQARVDAAVAKAIAEEDNSQDLYDHFNRNRALASALAEWGNEGVSDGS